LQAVHINAKESGLQDEKPPPLLDENIMGVSGARDWDPVKERPTA
jgi:hypothetical protein